MMPEVMMFVSWKNGHTTIDTMKLEDELATVILAMDHEFTSVIGNAGR